MRPRRHVAHQRHSVRFYVANSSSDLGNSSDDSLQDFSVDGFVNITRSRYPDMKDKRKRVLRQNRQFLRPRTITYRSKLIDFFAM